MSKKRHTPAASTVNVMNSRINIMSFDKYKENNLMSFEQYKEEYMIFVKTDAKGSALAKIQKAYNDYEIISYRTYIEKFFPPPNPLIF